MDKKIDASPSKKTNAANTNRIDFELNRWAKLTFWPKFYENKDLHQLLLLTRAPDQKTEQKLHLIRITVYDMVRCFLEATDQRQITIDDLRLLSDISSKPKQVSQFIFNVDVLPETIKRYVLYFTKMICYSIRVVELNLVQEYGHIYSEELLEKQNELMEYAQAYLNYLVSEYVTEKNTTKIIAGFGVAIVEYVELLQTFRIPSNQFESPVLGFIAASNLIYSQSDNSIIRMRMPWELAEISGYIFVSKAIVGFQALISEDALNVNSEIKKLRKAYLIGASESAFIKISDLRVWAKRIRKLHIRAPSVKWINEDLMEYKDSIIDLIKLRNLIRKIHNELEMELDYDILLQVRENSFFLSLY